MQRIYKQVTSFKATMIMLFAVTTCCIASLNAIVLH